MILIGTSGYSYPEWKGSFYPTDLATGKMLPYYADRFPTVEVNATFYRMPTAKMVTGWASQVPSSFRFTLKAPRRITHDKRLVDVGDPVRAFCAAAGELGPQLAALLFQLPPNFKKNLDVFDRFLETLPPKVRAAFEFRNESWWDDEVYGRLRARNFALCIAESEARSTPMVMTADFAYFRLRDEGYQDEDIQRWTDHIRALDTQLTDVFVYFKHEDEGKGAAFGQRMMELLARA
ncbi:MAG: DUF72 domain-containing protein [Acidobacteria bacterium]|nr:DUF72 domain-containing protein [Acidobacteriota bacterium]